MKKKSYTFLHFTTSLQTTTKNKRLCSNAYWHHQSVTYNTYF